MDWSLGVAPSSSDSADYITNANTKTVTIDSTTATNFPGTMTVNNLNIIGAIGSTNTLILNNAGMAIPLQILGGALTLDTNSFMVVNNSAVLATNSTVSVGYAGTGNQLIITNGGAVVSGGGYVGDSGSSSNNTVVVSDTGSIWSNSGSLAVGNSGLSGVEEEEASGNQLIIANGGAVFNNDGYIGNTANNDAVVVSGNGSVWNNDGNLYVGVNNEGFNGNEGNTLTVSNGGEVFSNGGTIGADSGVDNAVLVTGSGSVWSNSGTVYVGFQIYAGPGGNSLTIAQGGAAYSSNAYIGTPPKGYSDNNYAVVEDTGSVWRVSGQIYIVWDGSGWLTISNGGAVYCGSAFLESDTGADALVAGSGSVWYISGLLGVGTASGSIDGVTVTNGGVLYTGEASVSSFGSYAGVTVSGTGSVWYNAGDLEIDADDGSGSIYIQGGGTMFDASADLAGSHVVVTDSGSVWNNSGTITLSEGTFDQPSVTVANGGVAVAGDANISGNNQVAISGGVLYVTNGLGGGLLAMKGGGLTLDSGTVTVDNLALTSSGTFNFASGTLYSGGTSVSNSLMFVVGDGIDAAIFQLNGGVHSFANNLEISNNATLSGCGTINGNVVVDPGGTVVANCSGTLTFTGIVTNNGEIVASGGTDIEFFGPVVNNGVIDSTGGNVQFVGGLQNNGTILPRVQITSITTESNSVLVTWNGAGGHSYVLQSTKSTAMIADYNTNFVDASPMIVVLGVGPSATNYLDAEAAYVPVLTAPGGAIVTTSTVPSTVYSSAAWTRGITDSLGNALPVGSVLMLGTFSIGEPTIQSNFLAGNVSAIMSNFTPYSTPFAVGDGTGLPASWDVSLSAAGFGGRQIYLLAIDAPTLTAANHLGIFTTPSWTFPVDGGTNTIDLEDVTDFVIGAQGGSLTISLPLGSETYTFTDTAKLSYLPGRILFYRVRLAQ